MEFYLTRQIQIKDDEKTLRVRFWLVVEAEETLREEDRTALFLSVKESKGGGGVSFISVSIDREEEELVVERSFGDPEEEGEGEEGLVTFSFFLPFAFALLFFFFLLLTDQMRSLKWMA